MDPPNLPLKGETSLRYWPLSACLGVLLYIPLCPGRPPLECSMGLWLPLELSMLRLGLAGGGDSKSVTISSTSW